MDAVIDHLYAYNYNDDSTHDVDVKRGVTGTGMRKVTKRNSRYACLNHKY